MVAFHIMKGGWTTVTTLYTVFARKLERMMKMILNILLCAIKLRRGRKKEDHSGYKDEILIVTLMWTPRDLLHMVMVIFWFI